MTSKNEKLKAKASELKAEIQVGQKGLNKEVLKEIGERLKQRKLVKVKINKSISGNRKILGKAVAQSVQAGLVDVRGNNIVLYKEK